MLDLYTAHSKVIRHISRIPERTHNWIVIKLAGDLVWRLDRKIAKFIFNMVNYDSDTLSSSTIMSVNAVQPILNYISFVRWALHRIIWLGISWSIDHLFYYIHNLEYVSLYFWFWSIHFKFIDEYGDLFL